VRCEEEVDMPPRGVKGSKRGRQYEHIKDRRRNIRGRSKMTKAQLQRALSRA
jgi:hypothetical protein